MTDTRRWIATLSFGLVLLAGCSSIAKIDFTSPGRDGWQRPHKVVDALDIEPGARVADLGAGEGYFVPHLATAVGATGTVYAVEVEAERTRALAERFSEASNIQVVLGEYSDPRLPDAATDLVVIVNTYHHIEDRPGYFEQLIADLAPGGRVAVIDPNAKITGPLRLLLDEGHMSHAEEVVEEMRAAGYRQVDSFDFLLTQIFLVFEPEAESELTSR